MYTCKPQAIVIHLMKNYESLNSHGSNNRYQHYDDKDIEIIWKLF
jgi:hypothetical protein